MLRRAQCAAKSTTPGPSHTRRPHSGHAQQTRRAPARHTGTSAREESASPAPPDALDAAASSLAMPSRTCAGSPVSQKPRTSLPPEARRPWAQEGGSPCPALPAQQVYSPQLRPAAPPDPLPLTAPTSSSRRVVSVVESSCRRSRASRATSAPSTSATRAGPWGCRHAARTACELHAKPFRGALGAPASLWATCLCRRCHSSSVWWIGPAPRVQHAGGGPALLLEPVAPS